ncbi:MAG TPA: mycofactocin biosynthesis glycosyltransferase MftF [Acidimicrobiales bacterium]|nr:mycofactocin biosynthesis glycosyltransferase MftF [Acidimicrobiales bacterium]
MSRDLLPPILLAGASAAVPWETQDVILPAAPTANALESPLEAGTRVELDPRARFHDTNLVTGGSPWRLWHLPGASRATLERWRAGGAVRAGEGGLARTLVQQGLLRTYRETPFDVDELDVVVPFLGDAKALGGLLEQLAGLHVTVVDDASSGPEALRHAVEGSGATLVRHEARRGPAAARNSGLRATTRPFVCFLDADVYLDDAPGVLARLRAAFHDPLVGAVAPRVRGTNGSSPRDRFEARFSPLDRGPDSGLVRPNSAVNFVPSALLVVRREAVGDGFDESLRYGEDVDLVWRLNDQGWLVRYEADVVVTHPARSTWLAWWRQRVHYGASSAALARRYGSRLAPLRVDPVTASALLGVLFARPALSARVLRVAQRHFAGRLPRSTDRPEKVAQEVVAMGVARSAGPLARALVRSYAPLLVLGLFHPKLRRRLVVVVALGVAWRWRRERFRAGDLPLALADDVAYAVGVWSGAWRERTWRGVVPYVAKTSIRLSDLVRLT